jgi:glycyl-tRNA synthetase beta chain
MGSDAIRPLLVELLVEELPPKALARLGASFSEGIAAGLRAEDLLRDGATVTSYATPRRLAVLIDAVAARAVDRSVSHKLMPTSVGFTAHGEASPALLKKLAALGADAGALPRLQRRLDGKSETLFLDAVVDGAKLVDGLQRALDSAIAQLPIPKAMQYQLEDGWTSVSFVRPAHGLVALHGDEIVPISALGLVAGRTTLGHRFEARHAPIALRSAETYAVQLRDEGAVIASFAERRAATLRQLQAGAAAAGLALVDDDALLDEVTGLVERPNVLACEFEREFLEVPAECLVLTMKANQKYFPLVDREGRLTNRFLVVSNISPADPSRIVEGNERVVRPRLADAKFFFDQDRKKTLASRVPGLDKVVYHARLGSQGARVARLRAIARWVAERIGADVARAERAATLAKADLLTDMVGEFPELQGIMGGYYARHDGEPEDVAQAIADQYMNRRGADEDEARNLVGVSLLLADRTETLVGIWGIGAKPTGEKDPFALRRHALTVIQAFSSLGASASRLFLRDVLETARTSFDAATPLADGVVGEVEAFVYERYANQLASTFDARAVAAVLALRPPLQQVVARLEAVRDFQSLDAAEALAAANKRVGNILRKSDAADAGSVDPALLKEPAEIALDHALATIAPSADSRFAAGDYAGSLRSLAALREPVDAFFDAVMVNADDPALRANRLALLARLHAAMNRIADLSRLAG